MSTAANGPGFTRWTTGRRRSGTGAMCWPRKFTSVEEMLNPILHLKQLWDRDQYGWKEDLWGFLKGLEKSMFPPIARRGGGANVPRVCDGHAMLAQDSTYGPWETAQLGEPSKQDGATAWDKGSLTWCMENKERIFVHGKMIQHIFCSKQWWCNPCLPPNSNLCDTVSDIKLRPRSKKIWKLNFFL